MQPRLIRLRDAANYLGMDRNRFNKEVRPFLITLKIGQQGIAFDRKDLDQWANEFKKHQGQPAQCTLRWQSHEIKSILKEKKQAMQSKKSIDEEFQQLTDQLLRKKNRNLSS
jgi:predicted DNA-binding transcriptional regulator AlpA